MSYCKPDFDLDRFNRWLELNTSKDFLSDDCQVFRDGADKRLKLLDLYYQGTLENKRQVTDLVARLDDAKKLIESKQTIQITIVHPEPFWRRWFAKK